MFAGDHQRAFRANSLISSTARPWVNHRCPPRTFVPPPKCMVSLGPTTATPWWIRFWRGSISTSRARVEQKLARKATPRRRQIDPAELGKYRAVFAGFVAGSVVVGLPLTFFVSAWLSDVGRGHEPLMWAWAVILAVYGLAAYRLRRR